MLSSTTVSINQHINGTEYWSNNAEKSALLHRHIQKQNHYFKLQ